MDLSFEDKSVKKVINKLRDIMNIYSHIKIVLNPISDTEAVVTGLANGEGGTVRVRKTGATENIYYSGFMLSPVVKNKLSSMH